MMSHINYNNIRSVHTTLPTRAIIYCD